MSFELHFLDYHLDFFSENLMAVRDENGERYQQDISTTKKRYHDNWSPNVPAGHCWTVRGDATKQNVAEGHQMRVFVAPRPNTRYDILIHEVSRSNTTTHHNRQDSPGGVISSSQRSLPDNTHNTQTSMSPVEFEPTTSACEWPQTHALTRTATGTAK